MTDKETIAKLNEEIKALHDLVSLQRNAMRNALVELNNRNIYSAMDYISQFTSRYKDHPVIGDSVYNEEE